MKLIAASFLLVPFAAAAGGDYASGKVADFSGQNGSYAFTFKGDRPLVGMNKCPSLKVLVEYQRVPWFSWLPFIESGHPTEEETDKAAKMLQAAEQGSNAVSFGYMGNGLVPSGEPCTFKSKGLSIKQDAGKEFVLSFHDQT